MESTEITCPDCGKVIAPAGTIADNRRCRCGEQLAAGTATPVKPQKTCYVCGTNLEGKKRLKDHLGRYWCTRCAAADERTKKKDGEHRCPDCGRRFPEHKLMYFQADRVCQTCYRAREKALERKIAKAGAERVHKSYEFNKLAWLAIVGIGLILLAVLFQFVLR